MSKWNGDPGHSLHCACGSNADTLVVEWIKEPYKKSSFHFSSANRRARKPYYYFPFFRWLEELVLVNPLIFLFGYVLTVYENSNIFSFLRMLSMRRHFVTACSACVGILLLHALAQHAWHIFYRILSMRSIFFTACSACVAHFLA